MPATPAEARAAWDRALAILADDQPAIFLYTLTNTAVVCEAGARDSLRMRTAGPGGLPDWEVGSRP